MEVDQLELSCKSPDVNFSCSGTLQGIPHSKICVSIQVFTLTLVKEFFTISFSRVMWFFSYRVIGLIWFVLSQREAPPYNASCILSTSLQNVKWLLYELEDTSIFHSQLLLNWPTWPSSKEGTVFRKRIREYVAVWKSAVNVFCIAWDMVVMNKCLQYLPTVRSFNYARLLKLHLLSYVYCSILVYLWFVIFWHHFRQWMTITITFYQHYLH